MKPKRRRAPTNPLQLAHRKSDEQFLSDYLRPGTDNSPWVTSWSHPRTGAKYTISLVGAPHIQYADLDACLRLIEETSRADYERSSTGWQVDKKLDEMRTPELRYVLVREEKTGMLHGFTSMMPTYEEGQPVIYCYEIHLKPEVQGTGLGKLLMSFHETVARNMPSIIKVMLTCFLYNERGLAFYHKLGFAKDEISPEPRVLRSGQVFTPDYMIMSKEIVRDSAAAAVPN